MRWLLVLMVFLSACGRPLSTAETNLARAMFGPTLDTEKVRFSDGLLAGSFTYSRKARPRVTCTERLFPPIKEATVTVSPGAMAIFHRIRFREDLYRDDFLKDMPQVLQLSDAMLVAHELTHVWQWQNRSKTGYHPLKALGEHIAQDDPYLFDPGTNTRFLDHGYEQQGLIVEEYLCCRVLAPKAARTKRLHAMLKSAFPVSNIDEKLAPKTRIPWKGAKVEGICS